MEVTPSKKLTEILNYKDSSRETYAPFSSTNINDFTPTDNLNEVVLINYADNDDPEINYTYITVPKNNSYKRLNMQETVGYEGQYFDLDVILTLSPDNLEIYYCRRLWGSPVKCQREHFNLTHDIGLTQSDVVWLNHLSWDQLIYFSNALFNYIGNHLLLY